MTGPALVFALCCAASVLCAVLLIRSYVRTKRRFLLWCALSFGLIAINNTLVLLDILWPPEGNLIVYRQVATLSAVVIMIYGFMWEVE
jgi:hypothetical protein